MGSNDKFKVVFHLDEMAKWNLLIANVKNLLKAVDVKNSEILVVVNSEGIKGYLAEELQESLCALARQCVVLSVCNNSLVGFDIPASDMPDYVTVVPVAIVELVQRQQAGFAYIKP